MTEQENEREDYMNNEHFRLRGVELENAELKKKNARLTAQLRVREEIFDPPDEDVLMSIVRICNAAYPKHQWQIREVGVNILELARDNEGFIAVVGETEGIRLKRLKGALMGVVYADQL